MPFGSLWLPGVVSAVAVWIVSAIVHMVLRYHRADYKRLPDEEAVGAALRKDNPGPGLYFLPYCAEMSEMKDPAVRKKFEDGPVGFVTLRRNGMPSMGPSLAQWFLLCLLISFVTATIARHTLGFGTDGRVVFHITGAIAFVAYGFGYFQDSIWKGIPWSNTVRGLIDALLYGATTGLVFWCLWPSA